MSLANTFLRLVVLTKPDTLTVGSTSARQKWRDVLTGKYHSDSQALKLGYYCVKLADDAERETHSTRSERQERETSFFSLTEPWNEVVNRGRFGVLNLVNDLSRHLTALLDQVCVPRSVFFFFLFPVYCPFGAVPYVRTCIYGCYRKSQTIHHVLLQFKEGG